jgi:DNA-binding NarL/FixJ family response regulator
MTQPVRVLVVDDDALVRAGLTMMLDGADGIAVVGEAPDGDQVPAAADAHAPDVVLMDLRMPRVDGITATRRLRSRPRPPEVIVLTTFDTDENILHALRAGASGFLLKDTLPAELLAAVRVVASGEALLAPSITRRLMEEFLRRPVRPSGAPPPGFDLLTARELEVLAAVARGLSNSEVADALFMSHATAKTHVSRLLTKLGARDRAQLVIAAYEAGVVAPGSPGGG